MVYSVYSDYSFLLVYSVYSDCSDYSLISVTYLGYSLLSDSFIYSISYENWDSNYCSTVSISYYSYS